MLVLRIASVVTILVVSATLNLAQAPTTSLQGTVYDPSDAVVVHASVTLNNPATGFSRSVQTDLRGTYQFLEIPPSTYNMRIHAPGFVDVLENNVVLQVNLPATLNVQLHVQTHQTTVEVTAAPSSVNTVDASLGDAINGMQLQFLPAQDRDPVAILSLQPGVVYMGKNTVNTDNDSRGGAVNGARSDQSSITYDGLDNNDQLKGTAFQGVLRATLDSLQEFRVTTSNANADAGRSSGAQVLLVTKSGTNHWHGSVYEYRRPSFTSANDWFNKRAQLQAGKPNVAPSVLRNTFGGSAGGPIRRDRTFLFISYEGFRSAETQQVTRVVPTAIARQGFVKYLCNPRSDPNCRSGNAAGIQVESDPQFAPDMVATLTPAQLAAIDPNCSANGTCPLGPGPNPLIADIDGMNPNALFDQYPLPNTNAVGDLLNTAGLTFAAAAPTRFNTYIVKLDHKVTANGKHSLFLRGNLQDDHFVNGARCGTLGDTPCSQFPGQPASQTSAGNSKGLSAGLMSMLRPNLINNLRYGYTRYGNNDAGLPAANVNAVAFGGLTHLLPYLSRSVFVNVPVHNFVNDTTWGEGNHTIQFGTNWRVIDDNRASNEQNFSFGLVNVSWMNPSFISGTGTSLDPATGANYPVVDPAFGQSYDSAVADLAGIIPQVGGFINQNRNGNVIPNGQLIPRHFKSFEAEFYIQDSWRATSRLTLTAGLRYSLLQPPYEANGEQAQPTVSTHDWFVNRGNAALHGVTDQPDLVFDLSGQGNRRKPYWNWDYRDLAPRFAFAYSSGTSHRLLHWLLGSPGKSSIRGGYGIYFDHFGEAVVNTFDRHGSFGLTTLEINPAGVETVDTAPRFAGVSNVPALLLPPAPGKFPFTPSTDPRTFGLAIAWGLDDRLKTPYAHAFDLSITRDLPRGFVIEASFVGRLGRRLLQEADLATPLDLVDPKSGIDYFTAATFFSKLAVQKTPVNQVPAYPYWENLFPQAAGPALSQLTGCNFPGESALTGNVTATQAEYDLFACNLFNETLALEINDAFCFPACSGAGFTPGFGPGTPFRFYQRQFSSLYSWTNMGFSSYNGLQFSVRHAMSRGLQFGFNYVYSKSLDIGSNAERVSQYEGFFGAGVGLNDQIINVWRPRQLYGPSDFDLRHQINANWVYELPIGRGRRFGSGMGGLAQALLGRWGFSGIVRWTSGFPFSVQAGKGWSTDFNLQGNAIQVGESPRVGTFFNASGDPVAFDPRQFPTAAELVREWRPPFPGESGQRNNYRGPGYFEVDSGLGKLWQLNESQRVQFRWECFNVTNSVRFDAAASLDGGAETLVNITGFGRYSSTLTKPRVMQFSLRYEF